MENDDDFEELYGDLGQRKKELAREESGFYL